MISSAWKFNSFTPSPLYFRPSLIVFSDSPWFAIYSFFTNKTAFCAHLCLVEVSVPVQRKLACLCVWWCAQTWKCLCCCRHDEKSSPWRGVRRTQSDTNPQYRINQSCVERGTTNTARLTWYKQWDCTEAEPPIEAHMRSIWVLGGANQISYRQKRAWILGRGIIYVRM